MGYVCEASSCFCRGDRKNQLHKFPFMKDVSWVKFPKDDSSFRRWLILCRSKRKRIMMLSYSRCRRSWRLCSRHFDADQILPNGFARGDPKYFYWNNYGNVVESACAMQPTSNSIEKGDGSQVQQELNVHTPVTATPSIVSVIIGQHEPTMKNPEDVSKTELIIESKQKVCIKGEHAAISSCPRYPVLDPVWPSTVQEKSKFVPAKEDANLQDGETPNVVTDNGTDIDAVIDNDGWIDDSGDWINADSGGWISDDSPTPSSDNGRGQVECFQVEGYEWISSIPTASEGDSQSKISLKDRHEGESFHECGTCHHRFPLKSLLDEHITIHVKCPECSERFNSRKDLSKHMKFCLYVHQSGSV